MKAKSLRPWRALRGRSATELRERAAQWGASRLERLGLSPLQRLPREADVPEPSPGSRAWPPRLPDREAYRRFLDPRPGTAADLVAAADRILHGRLDILGFRDLSVGDPGFARVDDPPEPRAQSLEPTGSEHRLPKRAPRIEWRRDPVAGVVSPRRHWSRLSYLDPRVAGDHKVVWEINRHQWFLTLGRAWRLTGDDRYAACFVRNLASWMDDNPPKVGINWASSLELAYRAIAWLWAFRFFEEYDGLTPALRARARQVLFLHGRHIETYLSTYFSPNTHLTGEALGLCYLAAAFPEWRCADRWREKGEAILRAALRWQVRPDGVYFEQASYYHRYTADIYTHFYLLAGRDRPEHAGSTRQPLEALLEHLVWITRPDGTTPFVGDDDGGRLVVLDERRADDFRAALSTGAALFSRPDFRHVAGEPAEETFWLLGEEAVSAFEATPSEHPKGLSRGFGDGGYYVMRDGWAANSNWLLADCGVHGAMNGGHAHADALSIQLAARGVTALVDPGTYRYTTSPADRDAFRSSLAHNTVSVDAQSSSVPSGPFSWGHVARAGVRHWVSQPGFDFLEGEHDGYQRLPDPVRHVRSVLFIRDGYWVIRDRLEARGRHRYVSHFQFAPGLELAIDGNHVSALHETTIPDREGAARPGTSRAEPAAQPVPDSAAQRVPARPVLNLVATGATGRWEASSGRVSPAYGVACEAAAVDWVVDGDGPTEWLTVLVPEGAGSVTVAGDEGEFEVSGDGWQDVVVRGPITTAARGMPAGAFDWLWMRGETDPGETHLIVFGLRSLSLDAAFTLEADQPISWLSARLSRDTLEVSLEAGRTIRLVPGPQLRTLVSGGKAMPVQAGRPVALVG